MRNIVHECRTENRKTFYVQKVPKSPEYPAVHEIMWKNSADPDRPQTTI